jgi:hypothetical protein
MKAIICSTALMLSACCFGGLAQTTAAPPKPVTPPVAAKRVPAAQSAAQKPTKEAPPALQKYDFGGQLQILEDPTTMDAHKSETDGKVPKGFQPPTDVPLNRDGSGSGARKRILESCAQHSGCR